MANVMEMAALSLDVYRGNDQLALPAGWSILQDCPAAYQRDGYFGSAYLKTHPSDLPEVVIAHRGSDGFQDYWQDLELFLVQAVPKQCRVAMMPFVNEVIAHCDQRWGKHQYKLSHTGHSLGALLAELAFARCFLRTTHPDSFTVTFESPGAKPFYGKLVEQGEFKLDIYQCARDHVRIFNADVDAINSLYEHVGVTHAPLPVGYDYYQNEQRGYPLAPNLLYFFWGFTLNDQHSMQKLYDYCYKHPNLLEEASQAFSWPVGLKQALQYYLTYEPAGSTAATRRAYWDEYMSRCWASRPKTRVEYGRNKNEFIQMFIKRVLS